MMIHEAMRRHALGEGPAPRDAEGRLICPDCLGTGEGKPYTLTTAYSDEPPEWLTEPCLLCRGTGRLDNRRTG